MYDYERANTYKVLNALGQQVYTAFEVNTTHCSRNCSCCCCPSHLREFEISVRDNLNIEVARFQRPYKCNSCCFNLLSCSLQEMSILDRAGNVIGSVKQKKSCRAAVFDICDENGNIVLELKRDDCCMCGAGDFDVYTSDDVHIGKVTKEWGGYVQETRTEADNFGIEFPIDLDVKCKTVILGALFLIVRYLFVK